MPKYFNIVKFDVEDISNDTVVYLVKTSNRRFTLQAYSTSEFDQMRADPITRENVYWRIPQECLPTNSHSQAYNEIFPDEVLRTLPLTIQQVKEYLSIEPIVAGLNDGVQEEAAQTRRIDAERFNSRSLSFSHGVRYFDASVTRAVLRDTTSVEDYITDRLIPIIYELEHVIKAESRATDIHCSQHRLTPLLRFFQKRQLDRELDHLHAMGDYKQHAILRKKFILNIMVDLMMSSQGRDFHQFLIDNGVTQEQVHLLIKQPENLSKLEIALDHIEELKTLVTDQTISFDVIFTLEDEQLEILLQNSNPDARQEILASIGYEPPTLS